MYEQDLHQRKTEVSVTVTFARTHFYEILRAVDKGLGTVVFTKRGKPYARMVPSNEKIEGLKNEN